MLPVAFDTRIVRFERSSCPPHAEDAVNEAPTPTLDQLLAERGISVDALAVLSELDPVTAYRIRNGQVRPRPTSIVRLASALGIGARRMQRICDATWDAAHREAVRDDA